MALSSIAAAGAALHAPPTAQQEASPTLVHMTPT
jgi:hypothetical protein